MLPWSIALLSWISVANNIVHIKVSLMIVVVILIDSWWWEIGPIVINTAVYEGVVAQWSTW